MLNSKPLLFEVPVTKVELLEKTGTVNEIEPPLVKTEKPEIKIDMEFLKKRPLSYSSLKHFNISPKDYIWYLTKPYEPPSDALILGKAIECLVFEKEKFKDMFTPYGYINKRTNDGKAEWNRLLQTANLNKKTLISEDEIEKAKGCAQAVIDNDMVRPYIEGVTRTQIKLEWTEKRKEWDDFQIPMIGYADLEGEYKKSFVGEFKSTQDGSDDGFPKQAYNFDYHLQLGTYSLGYHKKFYRFPDYYFIVVETKEPYKSNIFYCDPKYLQQCRDEIDYLLICFKYCFDNNLWHQGYEFWQQSMPYGMMKLPGYAKLRSKE